MRTWTFAEARPPGDGPWCREPDKAQWVDEATGLDCLIVRGPITGALCGYVGVPPGHPFHGQSRSGDSPASAAIRDLAVHGGVNFTSLCQEGGEDGWAVCHVPEPGRPEQVWWLGFDCSHAWDLAPTMRARMLELIGWYPGEVHGHYRDFDYVRGQVTLLAHQVHANSASNAFISAGVDADR